MRAGPGIDITHSEAGRLLRTLVGLLTVLALLAGSGVGRQAAAAHGAGGNVGAAAAAMDNEEDSDEGDSGIDLPFTSRDDDDEASAASTPADDVADQATPAGNDDTPAPDELLLRTYVCTPGDDTDLRNRLLVESSTISEAFFQDGIALDELREVCPAPADEITYTLTANETEERVERELGGDEDAAYTWTGLSGPLYYLSASVPETYGDPIIICTFAGQTDGAFFSFRLEDGAMPFSPDPDDGYICDWFNVDLGAPVDRDADADGDGIRDLDEPAYGGDADNPDTDGDGVEDGAEVEAGTFVDIPDGDETTSDDVDEPAEDADQDNVGQAGGDVAAISIQSYTCADDGSDLLDRIAYQNENWTTVDPVEGVALDELRDTCELTVDEIAFTVTDQETSESEEKVLGGEENDDYVTWEITANAGYAVDADEPEGYGEPIVFCAFHDTGEPAEDLAPSPMTDGVLYVGMGAGTTYTCDWFNVDLGGAGGGGDEATSSQTGAEDGNFALRAYTCTPGDDAELRARIAYQIENWTTVDPAEGITLDDLREECEPADGSVAFSVTEDQAGGTDELVVKGEDYVAWELEPLTSYTIAADEPDGYGEPLLFCSLDDREPSQSPIIEGNLFLILGEGVTDSCEWFHVDLGGVPLEEPSDEDENAEASDDVAITESDVVTAESAAISIQSYTCTDDGSDLLKRIAYQREHWIAVDPFNGITLFGLREFCELSSDEITFTVTDQDTTEQVKKVVGGVENDGYVTWEVVPDADNTIDADEPDGYGEPIAFCGFHDTGELADDEDLSPAPMDDDVLNVGMSAGTTYTCDWFHVDLGDSAAQGGVETANVANGRRGDLEPAHHA